jgi:hypothetical protein
MAQPPGDPAGDQAVVGEQVEPTAVCGGDAGAGELRPVERRELRSAV